MKESDKKIAKQIVDMLKHMSTQELRIVLTLCTKLGTERNDNDN